MAALARFLPRKYHPSISGSLYNRLMAKLSANLMRMLACLAILSAFLSVPAVAGQLTLADLYKMCTSSDGEDKAACRFYILGVFEGAEITGASAQNGPVRLQAVKDKRYCVPDGLSSSAMEMDVKVKMGSDLAVFPQDQSMPAVSFVTGVMMTDFACKK